MHGGLDNENEIQKQMTQKKRKTTKKTKHVTGVRWDFQANTAPASTARYKDCIGQASENVERQILSQTGMSTLT